MPDITIREIQGDELLEGMYPMVNYAFRSSPPFPDKDSWKEMEVHREGGTYLALYEGNVAAAFAGGVPLTQQVRGALYPMGGVWGVACHPAMRRSGYTRRLLAHLLGKMREQGQVLSCLGPFRESFYERLGYVSFALWRKARLAPSALAPLLKRDLGGEVELRLMSEAYDIYRGFLRQVQQRIHGMAIYTQDQPALARRYDSWLALARVGGELVGVMPYELRGDGPGQFTLRATRFYYTTHAGRYLLLEWIARHTDQANAAEIWLPPFELPETWLNDLQLTMDAPHRASMGRVLDVARLGGMATGPGSFTARLVDPLCPWNEGCWRFETVDGILQVSTADEAECSLNIQAIAALVYGPHDPADFALRGWGDPSPELQATLRAMFPLRLPYLHEAF